MRNELQIDFLHDAFLSPKELASRASVTPVTVYSWLHKGLPFRRRGLRGSIQIDYADYMRWMVDCARAVNVGEKPQCSDRDVPEWAIRSVRSANG